MTNTQHNIAQIFFHLLFNWPFCYGNCNPLTLLYSKFVDRIPDTQFQLKRCVLNIF